MSLAIRPEARQSIGVFDSGLGGLTVVREIRRQLPHESVVYFGDIARLPYGIKSNEQILNYSIQNTLFLLKKKVKAVVIACNSSSSAAYRFLKNHFGVPILDVITPAVEAAILATKTQKIGLIATQATVSSGSYDKAIRKLDRSIKVYKQACTLFVPLVEEGWLDNRITDHIIDKYMKELQPSRVDTLILGCTHYPLLTRALKKAVGPKVKLIDSAIPTVEKLASLLDAMGLSYPQKRRGKLEIYVSDMPRNFQRIGERFLGEKLNTVKVVRNP